MPRTHIYIYKNLKTLQKPTLGNLEAQGGLSSCTCPRTRRGPSESGNIRATLPRPTSAYHTASSVSALSAFLSPTLPQASYAQFSKQLRRICAVRWLSRVEAILSQALLCRGTSRHRLGALPGWVLQGLRQVHVCPGRMGTQVLNLLVEVVALRLQGSAQFLQALDFHLKPLQLFIPQGFLQTERQFSDSTTPGTKAERERDKTSKGSLGGKEQASRLPQHRKPEPPHLFSHFQESLVAALPARTVHGGLFLQLLNFLSHLSDRKGTNEPVMQWGHTSGIHRQAPAVPDSETLLP